MKNSKPMPIDPNDRKKAGDKKPASGMKTASGTKTAPAKPKRSK